MLLAKQVPLWAAQTMAVLFALSMLFLVCGFIYAHFESLESRVGLNLIEIGLVPVIAAMLILVYLLF